jgi:hypothetical protein
MATFALNNYMYKECILWGQWTEDKNLGYGSY